MSTWLTVVETETYRAVAERLMSQDERDAVIAMIAQDPMAGDLIVGTGDCARFAFLYGARASVVADGS